MSPRPIEINGTSKSTIRSICSSAALRDTVSFAGNFIKLISYSSQRFLMKFINKIIPFYSKIIPLTKIGFHMQNMIVSLQNATIQNENQVVLADINFKVTKGDFVFLIGKTGAGKSSLLKVLYGDLPLSNGMGSILGYDLEKLKDRDIPSLRRKLGVVFQDFKLLPDRTVFDNLAFVLKATGWSGKEKIKTRVNEVLSLSLIHI
mgnify:CR=1 FL=1